MRRSVRLSETWPLPTGVARGPLRATKLRVMESMASGGMLCLPSMKTGETSIGSHFTGALAAWKMSLTDWEI